MDTSPVILIVDDEPDLLDSLEMALAAEGYQVLKADHGQAALELLSRQPVDLVLADIAMPHMNGYQLYERVRENPDWLALPFIFLSARVMDTDVRYGKELGVDDYLAKPIRAADLIAVLKGKLRRGQQLKRSMNSPVTSALPQGGLWQIGALSIDVDHHQVVLDNDEIKLSAREFSLLTYLAERTGKIVSHQELIQITHELDTDPIEAGALLRPLVFSLRNKLRLACPQYDYVENVRGLGYRLINPVK